MVPAFLVLAVALGVTSRGVVGSTSSPTASALINSVTDVNLSESYSVSSFYADDNVNSVYPDCAAPAWYIADGLCHSEFNNALCGWDGGDCCECTCSSSIQSRCGLWGYDCEDPDARLFVGGIGCRNMSFQTSQVPSCPQDMQVQWVVEDTADATTLAEETLCSGGGILEVEWRGHVDVTTTIHVFHGTSLRITGVSDAVADGGGVLQLLLVINASLHLSNVEITNGAGSEGGAIVAAEGSEIFADGVTFRSNTAQTVGGAIYLVYSNAELVSTNFESNSAGSGGAMFLFNSTVITRGYTNFISNNASGNGGALFITRSSYLGWNMKPVFPSTSLESSTYGYLEKASNSSYTWPSYYTYYGFNITGYYGSANEVDWIAIDDSGETVFMDNSAGDFGGAMFAGDCGMSWAGKMALERNRAQYGGALYLDNDVTVRIQGSTAFASNDAVFDGGAIGAAALEGVDNGYPLFIANGPTIFVNNTCGGNGGAIDLTGIYIIVSENMSFSGNSAVSHGGALYANQVGEGPTLIGVKFSDNFAEAGGAVFFSAVGTYEYHNTDDESAMPHFYSSKFIECSFDGNSAFSTGGAIHTTAGKDLLQGTTFVRNSAEVGGALRVSGTIGLFNSTFIDNKSGEGGGPAISNGGIDSEMGGLLFSGNGYHCSSDAFMGLNETSSSDSRYEIICDGCYSDCQECIVEDGYTTPVCEELPDHANSRGGKATLETLILDPGYWRATNRSKKIMACFHEEACRGGVSGNREFCLVGYEGPYCAVCSQGYAGTLSHRCIECSEDSSVVPAACAIIIAGLLALLFVYYMISIERDGATWASVDWLKAAVPLQSFKIIIISWQIVTQFSMVANVVYPSLYQNLLDVIALANFDLSWIPSAGCMMDIDFHVELVAATVGPLLFVALLGLTYTVALHRNRGSERALRAVRRKHVSATIVIALLLYSSASSAVFRAFACESLEDGKLYLRSDYRIECSSPRHQVFQIYAGFMIMVYPLGIPILFALLLFRNRQILTSTSLRNDTGDLLQQSTSNLWKPYKPSAFYYEVVECGRRVMLTGVVVFIYPNTAAQIAVTFAIAFILAFTSERLDPYDSYWDGWVSRIGHAMVVLTMYVALLTKVDVSSEGAQSQALFGGILVTAHIAMILTAVVEAIALVYSVRQRDTPLPRTRSNPAIPVDGFSSLRLHFKDNRRLER